jgi:Fe-Mn family superoxide dismutase
MQYELPKLPYAFDALEPYIDARTMEIHHDKHHAAYVTNLNKAIEGLDLGSPTIEELLAAINTLPDAVRGAVRNHGGGHANHGMFWQLLKRDGGEPKGDLATAIDKHFGNFAAFREAFTKAAMGRFGSGWGWLSLDPNKKLVIESSANQDSPVMVGNTPILGIDVWEHAYYLKYQNRRAEYVDAFYHVIDWDAVAENYDRGRKHAHAVQS